MRSQRLLDWNILHIAFEDNLLSHGLQCYWQWSCIHVKPAYVAGRVCKTMQRGKDATGTSQDSGALWASGHSLLHTHYLLKEACWWGRYFVGHKRWLLECDTKVGIVAEAEMTVQDYITCRETLGGLGGWEQVILSLAISILQIGFRMAT